MKSISQVLLWTLLLTAGACKVMSEPVKPKSTMVSLAPVENAGMHDRNLELAALAKTSPTAKLVFLGDSITQSWDTAPDTWNREFGPYDALNLGVSGDCTENVLWRLAQGSYDKLSPKVIVMMIGTNNTGHRMDPPADIAAGVGEILAQLKKRFPKTRIVLLAIFPRGETLEDPSRKNNAAVNALLVPIAKQAGVEWLDLTRAFVDEKGVLSKDLMPDLLHPNPRGYEVWANAIREPLKRWMQ